MGLTIFLVVMLLVGVFIMACSIFVKKETLESSVTNGTDDWYEIIFVLLFFVSPVMGKRILLFLFGLGWSGIFAYVLISGSY